jgi:hypothetical protein
MRTHRHHLITLTVAALIAAGCSADPAASASRTADEATPTVIEHPSVRAEATCFNPHGGECLGDLAPGTYRTTVFQPAIRYRVGRGWVNAEELPGNFLLYRRDDPQEGFVGGSYVGIFTGVGISMGCREARNPRVDDTPEALRQWYVDHPGLVVTNQRDVTVGGLRGISIDLALAPGYRRTCPWSEGIPVVPMMIGNGVSELFHCVVQAFEVRLVMLEWRGSNVTIEITSVLEQHTFEEYMELTEPIIRSLRFGD